MSITSMLFLGAFLPVCMTAYYLVPIRLVRECILLLASLAFYALGSPKYLILFIIAIAVTVGLGRGMAAFSPEKCTARKLLLILGIAANLSILAYYKYADFGIRTVNHLTGSRIGTLELALPLGISFYTFKAISYLADVYKGTVKPEGTPVHDALYLSFFPQIQSGPLVRYGDFKPQTADRGFRNPLFADGTYRFVVGFNKKVLLSNVLVVMVNEIFATPFEKSSAALAWLGAITYAMQIYFDFSGYTDMAIGLSEMFGYPCTENFNYPYMTPSVSKFWRRWHISLSEWFRDYVYFPLGGSRTDKRWKVYRNLLAVWLLTGLWHGASVSFILWGLGFFIAISFEKCTGLPERIRTRTGRFLYRIPVLLFIIFEWILFRADSISQAGQYLMRMFTLHGSSIANLRAQFLIRDNLVFLMAGLVLCFPIVPAVEEKLRGRKVLHTLYEAALAFLAAALFIWAVSYIISGQNNPFAYANF